MSKKKTRKQKDSAELRRQVEALKAELKVYKGNGASREELPSVETPRWGVSETRHRRVSTKDDRAAETKPEPAFDYTKKDLRKTMLATAVCLAVLAAFYFLLPYQNRMTGFFKYGSYRSFSNWVGIF